jgi:tetratricopeptide (TPR) repeat protein
MSFCSTSADGERKSSSYSTPYTSTSKNTTSVLTLDPKSLVALTELRRVFGASIVEEESREKLAQLRGLRGPGGKRVNKKMVNSHRFLVNPKTNWPPASSVVGLKMELTQIRGGVAYYAIVWNREYSDLQNAFYTCVQTNNLNSISNLLAYHPYHVDSLLQLAEVLKQTGEYQQAEDLIERCLFAYESIWHATFWSHLQEGTARLSFNQHESNNNNNNNNSGGGSTAGTSEQHRGLFFSVFRYIQMLGRKGCYRTALEYCKLLLGLDPKDPLFVAMMIDYFALMSKQFTFLVEFTPAYASMSEDLVLLPNLVFSTALAHFMLCEGSSTSSTTTSTPSSLEIASERLQEALILFPMALEPLLKKTGTVSSMKGKDGKQYIQELFFAGSTSSPQLDSLIRIFAERHYSLWQPTNVQTWLKENVERVLERVTTDSSMVASLQGISSLSHIYLHRSPPPLSSTHTLLCFPFPQLPESKPSQSTPERTCFNIFISRNTKTLFLLFLLTSHKISNLFSTLFEQEEAEEVNPLLSTNCYNNKSRCFDQQEEEGEKWIPMPCFNSLNTLDLLLPWVSSFEPFSLFQ